MPAEIALHPLLRYSHHMSVNHYCCSILWDLREVPRAAACHESSPDRELSLLEFSQHATVPPVTALNIVCDVFPSRLCVEVRNADGITVLDVLETIHAEARRPLQMAEWERMTEKQQERVRRAYDERWRAALYPDWERDNGVRKTDCLLAHTRFGGLSVVPVVPADEETNQPAICVLTLARLFPPPRRSLSQDEVIEEETAEALSQFDPRHP